MNRKYFILIALVLLAALAASAAPAAAAVPPEPVQQNLSDLERMKKLLDCTCECGLNLAYCEKEDAGCSERPALVKKLKGLLAEGRRGKELILDFTGPLHPVREDLLLARLAERPAVVFFYQQGSRECEEVNEVLKKAAERWGDRVKIARVDINKQENSRLCLQYSIFEAPVVLVFASNGVITRQFKKDVTLAKLESGFVSPAMAEILRGLQDRRVIFLTVHAANWKSAAGVAQTVDNVAEILRNSVRTVHVDPADGEEASLLKRLRMDTERRQAMTYVISRSGGLGSRLSGAVSKKDLFLAFQNVLAARSGCGGTGSGPGGNTCK